MVPDTPKRFRILKTAKVEEKLGCGRTTLHEKRNPESPSYDPDFPLPIRLGTGKNPPIGWLEHELDDYIALLIARSRPQDREIQCTSTPRRRTNDQSYPSTGSRGTTTHSPGITDRDAKK